MPTYSGLFGKIGRDGRNVVLIADCLICNPVQEKTPSFILVNKGKEICVYYSSLVPQSSLAKAEWFYLMVLEIPGCSRTSQLCHHSVMCYVDKQLFAQAVVLKVSGLIKLDSEVCFPCLLYKCLLFQHFVKVKNLKYTELLLQFSQMSKNYFNFC